MFLQGLLYVYQAPHQGDSEVDTLESIIDPKVMHKKKLGHAGEVRAQWLRGLGLIASTHMKAQNSNCSSRSSVTLF